MEEVRVVRGSQGKIQLRIDGMCCADEAAEVERALKNLNGVLEVQTSVVTGVVTIVYDPYLLDPAQIDVSAMRRAVEGAGCSIAGSTEDSPQGERSTPHSLGEFTRQVLTLFGLMFGAVLLVVVAGEWLGLFDAFTVRMPWPFGLLIVLAGGYPVFRNVVQATFKGRVTAHTLMTVGVLAALVVGEWATAVIVVFFMRVGDYAERFTTGRARRAVHDLTAMAPQMARIERDGMEQEIPAIAVQVGETVIVRPGEKISVDGEVIAGQATLDQAAITGESMPLEVGPGAKVFAATFAAWAACGSVRRMWARTPPSDVWLRWWRKPKRTGQRCSAWPIRFQPTTCRWWRGLRRSRSSSAMIRWRPPRCWWWRALVPSPWPRRWRC
jgi:cation transport ATPase